MRNRVYFVSVLIIVGAVGGLWPLSAQQPKQQDMSDCPMQQQHTSEHGMAEMNKRGAQAMGFSQTATTHHFRLSKDGGSIEVEANDAHDDASRDQIRAHLKHIAASFSTGDFEIPMLVHDETPPGVPVMRQLKDVISYKFEETERGGRVRIASNNAAAVAAIHEFLRFQIREHRTGDPLDMPGI